jgi:ABC-type uncharacterized transport system fused permease/ATPase subunit
MHAAWWISRRILELVCFKRRFAIVAPFIVASPGYFVGDISLGSLMVAVGAFNQVQQALRWFVDNFSQIADWRATLLRVASFRLALVEIDKLGRESGQIELVVTVDSLRLTKSVLRLRQAVQSSATSVS